MTSYANPFLTDRYTTPYQTVPFNEIKEEHYKEAFLKGIEEQLTEIDSLLANKTTPTFENTIVALEKTGDLISRTSAVFFNLLHAETNDTLENLAQELSPILTEHSNKIYQNQALFERVKAVYAQKETLTLTAEQQQLLENTYQAFVRSGAELSEKDKQTYTELSTKLSQLTLTFSQYVLKETNAYSYVITDEKELDGLPDYAKEAAAEKAKAKNQEGWLIDLSMPSYLPIMQYATNRELRKKLYFAYNTKGNQGNEYDNKQTITDIVNTRLQLAQLMGYSNYATYKLVRTMAQDTSKVYALIDQLYTAYQPVASQEFDEIQAFARTFENNATGELMPWDWAYYAEKVKEQKYQVNDELLKPYFELEKVKQGVFGLATALFDLQFTKNTSIQVYHPDVDAYEVHDSKGNFIAILYTDFHPRESKKGGAWMTEFKEQWIENGENSRPHISIVMNFTPPTATSPSLLTFNELTTLLHEFGHALHGMLSNTTYASLSGTSVYRDFVELPSQLLENWATEKEFLDTFAFHYQTGEPIPSQLIEKIKKAEQFLVGYACLRQLSFCYLDMAWHTLSTPFSGDVKSFETDAWKKTLLFEPIAETCMSTQFNHIFSGGYAAGYYSYKWAEVLDADAYEVFKQQGIFNKKTATSFAENILSKGGSEHPMILYKRFRGQEPTIDALLKRNGIK
ncbi:MAG: M3 family metallopeptidase [Paludibacteraceae bacterium]|nr:M3 family metallopeptidase [Paludibacteraceae bacterium]MBP8628158.1 M3 family metallopeptidase [Paludibacteraceae bacterium]MBP9648541.1 M3 family metallopeptidase [Paludibacteraceae bacterium]HOR41263.1 M3 family metallopeptidase [Paludibacteraceae bacterium]